MALIKTQQQYLRSRKYLDQLQQQLEQLRHRNRSDPELLAAEQASVARLVAQVERQLRAYEQAKAGQVEADLHALDRASGRLNVGEALLRLRLASGLTQGELARRVGSYQPNVNRWESPGCQSYTVAELQKLAEAMGRTVDIVFVAGAAAAAPAKPAKKPRAPSSAAHRSARPRRAAKES